MHQGTYMNSISTPRPRRTSAGVAAGALVASGLLLAGSPAQAADATVSRSQIADTATPYAGWHLGAGNADLVDVTADGVTMIGRTQVLNGFANNDSTGLAEDGVNADLTEDLIGSSFDVTGGEVHFQVPIYVDADDDPQTPPQFATLRNNAPATGATTISGGDQWTTSRTIGDVPANSPVPLSVLAGIVETHDYKTIGFGVYTDTNQIGSVASITFADDTYRFVTSGSTTSTTVKDGDVRDEETSASYDKWHQGYANATARHQVTADGLELAGRSQVIKGYSNNNQTLNTQNANLAFELLDASYTVTVGSDDVHFQVPLFFNDGSGAGTKFTTLRSAGNGPGTHTFDLDDQWQSSRALPGIPANTDASLADVITALGTYKTIGYGVLTNAGDSATVSNITFDGASYDFADAPSLSTTTSNALESDIAPNEAVYAGWHQGAATNTARIVGDELRLGAAKSQIINGYPDNSSTLNTRNVDLAEVLRSATYDVESGTVHFQIPMFFEDPQTHETTFTTLRTTAPADLGANTFSLGQEWTSSKAIGGVVDANGSVQLGDILSALPYYKVIAFGVFSDTGANGVVNSISWDGVKHTFVDADPTAGDVETSTRLNTPVDIELDGDDAESAVTYEVGTADDGTAELDGDTVTYTPDAGFVGEDEFTYTVSDGGYNTVTGTVTVIVGANTDPVAADVTGKTKGGKAVTVTLQATDADGDALTYAAEVEQSVGTVTTNGNKITFTPRSGFVGQANVSYTVTDGRGGSDTGLAKIDVEKYDSSTDLYKVSPEKPTSKKVFSVYAEVEASGLSLRGGEVFAVYDGRRVGGGELNSNNRVKITLTKKLPKGSRSITVKYMGTSKIAASKDVRTVKVR